MSEQQKAKCHFIMGMKEESAQRFTASPMAICLLAVTKDQEEAERIAKDNSERCKTFIVSGYLP